MTTCIKNEILRYFYTLLIFKTIQTKTTQGSRPQTALINVYLTSKHHNTCNRKYFKTAIIAIDIAVEIPFVGNGGIQLCASQRYTGIRMIIRIIWKFLDRQIKTARVHALANSQ